MQKTDVLRFKTDTEKLWGIYRGVVEDRYDPLRLGRVRVRIMGVHTEEQAGDLNKVPWEELQWAEPVQGTFGGSISDVGAWHIPLQGSHVMVFFENGNMMQPRYFGTVPGFPIDKFSQLEKQDGYIDPDDEYPLDDHIEEHDWHRLARVMRIGDTYIPIKEANLDEAVGIAFGGEWNEQPPMYETEYPHGNVFATEEEFDLNQVFEFDGTPGKQRLAYWHTSKSYFELNKDGRYVFRNSHNRWDICDMIKHVHTMLSVHEKIDEYKTLLIDLSEWREIKEKRWTKIHIDDWKKVLATNYHHILDEDYKKVDSNQHYIVEGTYLEHILESKNFTVDVDYIYEIKGDKNVTVHGDHLYEIKGNINATILSSMLKFIGSDYGVTIGGQWLVYADSDIGLNTPGVFDICGDHVAIGNTDVYIGATVNIGPTVNLGVDAAVATCIVPEEPPIPAVPDIPDPPIDAPVPPSPPIPPEFPPPEIKIEMPVPGC